MLHYWNLFEKTEYQVAEMMWEAEMVFCIHATAADKWVGDTGHDVTIYCPSTRHCTDDGFRIQYL